MAVPRSRRSAKELVQQICRDHGYLGEEQLQRMDHETRRVVEEALLKKDQMIGSAVITLARNLYTSQARFIFELLQNADDNRYTKATALNEWPRVAFLMYPRRIVFMCNEDGFTADNLKAICSVGMSSKSGAQGYIGEKGIGFKSVFMAAWKAHIHSGPFSFSFTHRPGDSGMGMISPIWETHELDIPSPTTSITLHLHDDENGDMPTKTRSIVEQFEDLDETLLLFMKNLRAIGVFSFATDDATESLSSVSYSIERPRANYAVLKKTTTRANTTQEHVKYFHVTTHEATDLARNENRTYSETEESTRAYSRSQVTLAFPLSETGVPIIEPQDLFVFLPVRAVGFDFIIQADFVTEASRQDIVEDSLRNQRLLNGIADAFAKAVQQFCHHDTLRYLWMRYLPARADGRVTAFWKSLIDKISARVADNRVLYCHNKSDLHLIRDLVRLKECHYENGQPLFDEGSTEDIISQRYDQADLDVLQDYGLTWAGGDHIMSWLLEDLKRGTSGRWKSPLTTESWRTQAAKVLFQLCTTNAGEYLNRLKRFKLLPLENGTWVSAKSGPSFFAQVEGLDIPSDIDLRIIAKNMSNKTVLRLFRKLGTKKASFPLVRTKILERYSRNANPTDIPLETSKCHLEFLYLTQHLKDEDEPSYARLSVHDQHGLHVKPHDECIYLASEDPYGPWELFKETAPGPNPGHGAPGYSASFVDSGYFLPSPQTPSDQELTWQTWLLEYLGVRKDVVFTINNATSWNGPAEYLREHKPEKFLGALRLHHQRHPHPSEDFLQCVRDTEVLCRRNKTLPLSDTYIPEESLEKRVDRYVEPDAFFPWLWLDPTITHDWKNMMLAYNLHSREDWFIASDMLFYSTVALKGKTEVESSSKTRLLGLYNHIQAAYSCSEDRPAAKNEIRDDFTLLKCIFIPSAEGPPSWAGPQDCVWDAPREMRTKFVLKLLYRSMFTMDKTEFDNIKTFLTTTLGISNCTWRDYIAELNELRESGHADVDIITTIYQELRTLGRRIILTAEQNEFRATFENEELIFLPKDDGPSWHKTSQCVWSTAASLRGRVSLNDDYENLQDFFVDLLGVRPVDLRMAIDELKQLGSSDCDIIIQDVKASIFTVNSLLTAEKNLLEPELILDEDIFPIRYPDGRIECHSQTTAFFIVDRDPLRRSFESQVKLLDFTLDEVVRLVPFLKWTRLDERYLSLHVKEITSFHGSDAQPLSGPNRDIRPRAHALLRIAFHFNSPRTKKHQDRTDLYKVLSNARTYETDGISSDLCLEQDGHSHMVEGEAIALHFGGDDANLKIYVPTDQDAQDYTFTNAFPTRLFQWLMTHPTSQTQTETDDRGVFATTAILFGPLSLLSKALEDRGIMSVDIANMNETVEQYFDSSEPSTNATIRSASDDDTSAAISGHNPWDIDSVRDEDFHTPESSVVTLQRDDASALGRNNVFRLPIHPRTSSDPSSSSSQSSWFTPQGRLLFDSSFTDLLTEVIAAGRRDTIPINTDFATDVPQQFAFERGRDFEIHGTSQFEKDCKLGAAGELYVFELLSHLAPELPGFSIDNWQSTMRKYITVHPDYATMQPWNGRETSDITYKDASGILTECLINRDYLHRDTWSGKTPFYFIEVKTTKQSCDAPFYMSNAQFERMRDSVLDSGNSDIIYMIFRVYNLGQANRPLGLKIYLDPETLRLANLLDFTARSWSVVPTSLES